MAARDIPWFPLNPNLAPYNSFEGARVNGITLLHFKNGDNDVFVVTGMCSCATRDDAERRARQSRDGRDLDQRITAATLLSWKAD